MTEEELSAPRAADPLSDRADRSIADAAQATTRVSLACAAARIREPLIPQGAPLDFAPKPK